MEPIQAIKGLEKEVRRIKMQGDSSFHSVNIIQEQQKLGVDIEIIKQLKLIKPNIVFYEPKTDKKSRASVCA